MPNSIDGAIMSKVMLENLHNKALRLRMELAALNLAARDPRTPKAARLLALAVIAYALSPIDLIPDFIPILGHLDDLLIVPAGIALAIRLIPPEVMNDCRNQILNESVPAKNYWAALVIAAIWLGALCAIIAALRH